MKLPDFSKMKVLKALWELILTAVAATLLAAGMYFFVYPSDFAPIGVNGIVTMIRAVTGWDSGLLLLIFNIPLIAYAWFRLDKKYLTLTLIYTAINSGALSAFEAFDFFSQFQYTSETDHWVAVIFSGVMMGIGTGIMLKIGGSSGGLDIVASALQKKYSNLNVETPISVGSYLIIAVSFFVYNRNLQSILFSVVQIYIYNAAIKVILKSVRSAIEVKIITDNPDPIAEELIAKLHHGVTVTQGEGKYTNKKKYVLVSVINLNQLGDVSDIVKKYEHTFVYFSEVSGVKGNFRWSRFDRIG